jgi:metal-responsive CopG/Arc/MetJ family transcriptional regulator
MILASISILSKNRQQNSIKINQILTDYSSLISARLGVNVQKKCTKNCRAIILLSLEGKKFEIKKLVSDLKKIKQLSLKLSILEKDGK